jgi:hypothetical protein
MNGNKMNKRDKLGIHSYIEKEFLKTLSLLIKSSILAKDEKHQTVKQARIEIEILKQLIRTEYELKIITEKVYLQIELKLQEISKMTNGWLKYLETQNPPKLNL